jgi:hypothetical protein
MRGGTEAGILHALMIACAVFAAATVATWIGSAVLPRAMRLPVGIAACLFGVLFLATVAWLLLGWMVRMWG